MTDPEFADATYVEPITPEFVEKVIAKERPDALLATLGGQTALNTAVALHERGVLEQVRRRADRRRHRGDPARRGPAAVQGHRRAAIGGDVAALARSATRWTRCARGRRDSGYPVVIRPSFTMGGLGSGHGARPTPTLRRIAGARAGRVSPVHRGAHRGDGARLEGVRARADARPARQRGGGLLDREHRPDGRAHRRLDHRRPGDDADRPRVPAACATSASRCCARSASTPAAATSSSRSTRATGRMVVIEMNPRVSRSSRAGVQGHRLPDRQDRGEAGHRLHPRRDPQRHHRRDPGGVRADAGLRGGEDPAVRVREVPRRRPRADHAR